MAYNPPTYGESGEVYTDNVRNSLDAVKSTAELAKTTADGLNASVSAAAQAADQAREAAAAAYAYSQAPTDGRVATLVNDDASETKAALSATFASRNEQSDNRTRLGVGLQRAALRAFTGATGPTLSAASAASSIPSSTFTPSITDTATGAVNPIFRYLRARPVQFSQVIYQNEQVVGKVSQNLVGSGPVIAQFVYDGSEFEIDVRGVGTNGKVRVKADGEWVNPVPVDGPPGSGAFYLYKVTLPTAVQRVITVEIDSPTQFRGVWIQPSTTIARPATTVGPRVIVFGDSYTEGTGADSPLITGFPARIGEVKGWGDVYPSGSGGTSYLATGPAGSNRVKLRDRAQTDVIDPGADITIVAAGYNDRGTDPATVATEAGTLYDFILAGLPDSTLIVVGPWWPQGATLDSAGAALRDALRAEAASRGLQFIDPAGWITAANVAEYIGGDGIHPTQAGHDYIARRIVAAMDTGTND